MKKLKVAEFSLTSVHADIYLNELPKRSDFELVAVSIADEDMPYVPHYLIKDNVKIYKSEEELLANNPDLDAVILAGANCQTYNQFLLCVKYGIKNILSMKVPTFDMDEYAEMQRLIKEKGIVFQIEQELMFDRTLRRIKELCDSGKIGKIESLQIYNTTVCVPPELKPWVTIPEKSYGKRIPLREGENRFRGGALSDHPHAFYLARYLLNSDFESLYAEIAPNIRQKNEVEDGIYIVGKMENGVLVSFDPSYSRHENKQLPVHAMGPGWEGYPKRVETNIIVNGEKGSIIGDLFHSGVYYTGLPYNTYAVQYVEGESSYCPSLDTFYNSCVTGEESFANINTHKQNIEAMNACYDSIMTGKTIYLKRKERS